MTKREAAIIMTYTDTCMLAGDDLKYYYKYISEILGYEVQTLDLAKTDLIKEKSKGDFIRLCKEVKRSTWKDDELSEYSATPVELCPFCKSYPEEIQVGDQKNLWVSRCRGCGFIPAYYDEAQHRGSQTGTQGIKGSRDRARIPKMLCEHIVDICEKGVIDI